jgi:BirA family biotin operon repressor/biotin-[acetyl-CoA-carboxylase] ligase
MEYDQLLQMFLDHQGEYLSGEEISNRLGISRTAVWKQINKLREQGYDFEAVSRKGYRLVRQPDKLKHLDVVKALQGGQYGDQLKLLETTTSTQEEIRIWAEQGADNGALIIAEEQTLGRGRQGRRWMSPSGKGVWMSLLLKPELPLADASKLTLLTAVAVCRALRGVTGLEIGIKWPNDLLINGKKICGILVESAGEDGKIRYCVVGIGIDVNLEAQDYAEELSHRATSLKIEGNQKYDRAVIIGAVMKEMEFLMTTFLEQGFSTIANLWEALSVTLGKTITVKTHQGEIIGVAEELDGTGALKLRKPDGNIEIVYSGEI